MVWPWWSVLGSGEAGRNLAQNLAPNLARNQEKKSRILGFFFVQDSVQDFFPLKMVQILHKNLAPKTL